MITLKLLRTRFWNSKFHNDIYKWLYLGRERGTGKRESREGDAESYARELPDRTAHVFVHNEAKLVIEELDNGKVTIDGVIVEVTILRGEEEEAALNRAENRMSMNNAATRWVGWWMWPWQWSIYLLKIRLSPWKKNLFSSLKFSVSTFVVIMAQFFSLEQKIEKKIYIAFTRVFLYF